MERNEVMMPEFETEKAGKLWNLMNSLTDEEKDDFMKRMAPEMLRDAASYCFSRWLVRKSGLSFTDGDRELYRDAMAESFARSFPTDEVLSAAWIDANRTVQGTIEGLEDMKAYLRRHDLRKKGTMVITAYDDEHRLVYTTVIKQEASVLSMMLRSIRDIYGSRISSMIFIMNDPELLEAMNRKLARGLLKRLGLALRSVGYDTTDILVQDGNELISLRQYSA